MAAQTSLNVFLTPELESFIQSRVASGRFESASEVVREGLRLLEEQEQTREEDFQQLKAKLERGAAQAERGEVVDGPTFMADRRAKLLARGKTATPE